MKAARIFCASIFFAAATVTGVTLSMRGEMYYAFVVLFTAYAFLELNRP